MKNKAITKQHKLTKKDKIKKTFATKFWRGTHILLLEMQYDRVTLEKLGQFLIKLNMP